MEWRTAQHYLIMTTTKTAAFDWGNFAGSAGIGALAGGAGMGLSSYMQNPEGETPDQKKQRVINSSVMGAGLGGVAGGAINAVPSLLQGPPDAPTGLHGLLDTAGRGFKLNHNPLFSSALPDDAFFKEHPLAQYANNALGSGVAAGGLHASGRMWQDGLVANAQKAYKAVRSGATLPSIGDSITGNYGGKNVRSIVGKLVGAYGHNTEVSAKDMLDSINSFGKDGKFGVHPSAVADVMAKANVKDYPLIKQMQDNIESLNNQMSASPAAVAPVGAPSNMAKLTQLFNSGQQTAATQAPNLQSQLASAKTNLNDLLTNSKGRMPSQLSRLKSLFTEGNGLTSEEKGLLGHSSPFRTGVATAGASLAAQPFLNTWSNANNPQNAR